MTIKDTNESSRHYYLSKVILWFGQVRQNVQFLFRRHTLKSDNSVFHLLGVYCPIVTFYGHNETCPYYQGREDRVIR